MRSRFKYLAALTASATMMAAVYFFTAIPSTAQGQTATDPYGGHPNLNGIWQATTTANWDLLAHTTRPAVAQPGVYPDVPVLAAPVLALGAAFLVPPGPGVVEGNEIPYKPDAAAKKKDNAEHWLDRDPT